MDVDLEAAALMNALCKPWELVCCVMHYTWTFPSCMIHNIFHGLAFPIMHQFPSYIIHHTSYIVDHPSSYFLCIIILTFCEYTFKFFSCFCVCYHCDDVNSICDLNQGGHPHDFYVAHRSARITDATQYYERDTANIKVF